MQVSSFYSSGCKDFGFYESLRPNKRNKIMKDCIGQFCLDFKSGKALDNIKAIISNSYQDEWFSLSWQKEQAIKDDVFKFTRLYYWLCGKEVLDTEVKVSVKFNNGSLDSVVGMVLKDKSGFVALNIFPGCAERSSGGKSTHTNINNDLYLLCAKHELEDIYPGIRVCNIYLTSPEDTSGNMVTSLTENGTLKSNVFMKDFEEYKERGAFLKCKLKEQIAKVLSIPIKRSCFDCPHEGICKVTMMHTPAINILEEDNGDNLYQMPDFTSSQSEVIKHKDGPIRVLAGPGSGKTAVVVGRIQKMMESGIDSDYILAITFTREAAGELKRRVESFTSDVPYISTIHSLCYNLLRDNIDLLGREVKLLPSGERSEIIKNLLDVYPPLRGIATIHVEGKTGAIKTVERKLDKLFGKYLGDSAGFLKEESSLGEDFIEFSNAYADIVAKNGYISFTEQITLCTQMLKEHPDVLKMYQDIFKYIMVDEFQDIDESQAEFIYLLASRYKNIMIVGDDDQNIYSFRGGSNKYMLSFEKAFPASKTVVLSENFRSSKALVDAAQSVIRNNRNRLEKEVHSIKGLGTKPVLLNDDSGQTIDGLINEFKKNGGNYKDIAIIATKNNTLENTALKLKSPCIIDRQIFVKNPLFLVVRDILSIFFNGLEDNYSLYHLLRIYGGVDLRAASIYEEILKRGYPPLGGTEYGIENLEDGIYKTMRLLDQILPVIRAGEVKPAFFISTLAVHLDMEYSPAFGALVDLLETKGVDSLKSALSLMDNMISYGDDTRIDVSKEDAVHLLTAHDSKGCEFPMVILLDDFSNEDTEETRRLLYVAITRAKTALYICTSKEKSIVKEAVA